MNKKIESMLSELDFSNRDIDFRLKLLNKILYENSNFLNNDLVEYLDNINVNLKQSDFLVSENKMVKILEKMADYLLHVSKNNNDDVVYKTYSYTDLIKKSVKEKKSIGIIIKDLYFNFASKNKNEIVYIKYKKNCLQVKKQKITKNDLETIPRLKEYEYLKEKIKKELAFLDTQNLKDKRRKTKLRTMYGELVSDQLIIKDSFLGTIYFKNVNNINIKDNDYIPFNFNDKNNILELLKCEENLTTSVGCIVHDLNVLIKKIKWTNTEKEIIDMYKNDKKIIEISYDLGIKYHVIRTSLNTIYKKIMKKYNESYNSWINKRYE